MKNIFPSKRKHRSEDHWVSLSDVMTSLMMIFLLISVIYMVKVREMVRIPTIYKDTLQGLGYALQKEFQNDLKKWKATIDEDLTVRFHEPNIMFATSSASLKPEFKEVLDDFFPRYIKIMTDPKYKGNIEEIRIEGHTSTIWTKDVSEQKAYFLNMELSQSRTRTTLQYLMDMPVVTQSNGMFDWLKSHVRAIGFSSGRPLDATGKIVKDADQTEDQSMSQRVEFRVRTDIERRVADIVERGKNS